MGTPHDDLFRAIFSRPEHAQALLAGFLPPDIAGAIEWNTLRLVPGTFLDEAAREQQVDLLFSVRIGGRTVLLYVLLEHKSSVDRWAALQLIGYVVQIWRRWRREHGKEDLPEVIPIVIHHGPRPWRGPTSIDELVEQTGLSPSARRRLARFRPRFRFLLVDLSRLAEAEIAARVPAPATRLVLYVMRVRLDAGFDDAKAALSRWRELMVVVGLRRPGRRFETVLWSYFFHKSKVTAD
ncbi:MAG: Rpn family recombination-promoting nuclease/putative transposase, partial [Planctomycetes bacterium]|nr:Rpn family recombination-promoting nuclease/putative transposase [Planctomycetota bacterium]